MNSRSANFGVIPPPAKRARASLLLLLTSLLLPAAVPASAQTQAASDSIAVQLDLISSARTGVDAPARAYATATEHGRPHKLETVDNEEASGSAAPDLDLFEYDWVDSLVIKATDHHRSDVAVDTAVSGELQLEKRVAENIAARELREAHIKRFFKRKWRGEKAVYRSLEIELDLLARYYAQHEEAYELIVGLSKQPVYFGYAANTFRTDVNGDALRVRSVKILFDPRSAAVLGQARRSGRAELSAMHAAMISSADALLHELLHADIVLNKGRDFIASGAMFSAFYPHEHEAQVIALERELFRAMSDADGLARPQRNTHRGYLLASSCATCLQ